MSVSTTQPPYSAVVRVDAQLPDGHRIEGSGVMVGPDEVLTAAHMVWEQGVGAAIQVTVRPGLTPDLAPFGTVTALDWHYFPIADAGGTETPTASQDDVALVHLASPVGNSTGWMSLEANFPGGTVHVAGYPNSLDGVPYNDRVMIDRVAEVARDAQFSLLDFASGTVNHGDSGGPLWEYGTDDKPYVVGIVSIGGAEFDRGRVITTSLYNNLQQWAAQDHSLV
jgi:V8-like Glu-specific endopeptidase